MDLKTRKFNLKLRDMCFVAIFTAVTAVLAQVSIPMPLGVPLTLQTFAVLLAGIVLGAKKGALAVVIYVLLGALGVPVFTGFQGGFAVILRHTGGFILSFPLMALCAGIGADLRIKNIWLKNAVLASGLIAGTAINFICGMFWGKFVLDLSVMNAFMGFVMPFILTSVLQIIFAGAFGVSVKRILKKVIHLDG